MKSLKLKLIITIRYLLILAISILGIVAIIGSSGGGGSGGNGDQDQSTLEDISGVWQLSTTTTSNTCDPNDTGASSEFISLIQSVDDVSIATGGGLWGYGEIEDGRLTVTGLEVKNDDMGCMATYSSEGILNDNSTTLEGFYTTTVTFDDETCGSTTNCTIETNVSLSVVKLYQSTCINRDDFGDPALSEYVLPYPPGKSYELNNGYCYPTGGHREQMAYDFLIPIGDTIVAARAGIVRQIKDTSPDDGQGSDHNHVMIEHADGTTGLYAHLKQFSVLVAIGENVATGQPIALAGHSGTTDVVHLHFGVYASYPPVEGNDRAINFKNTDGPVDCRGGLVMGETYTAL